MTTATITLTEFLTSRLAADEAIARASGYDPVSGFYAYDWPDVDPITKEHVRRHDPARVLAECEAKRRIIALHSNARPDGDDGPLGAWTCTSCGDQSGRGGESYWPCDTLRALALSYADHDDFRVEWRP